MRDKCVEMSDNTNKMRDRLIELLHEMPREMMIGEAADYFIANGVVALPYEEGQLVYVLRSKTLNGKNLYLKKEIISHYRIFKDRAYMFFKSGGLSVCDNLWKETVFLTEEEAERALKECEPICDYTKTDWNDCCECSARDYCDKYNERSEIIGDLLGEVIGEIKNERR